MTELDSIEQETVDGDAVQSSSEVLKVLAMRLKELDGAISGLNHEIANLKSERETVSDEIVAEATKMGEQVLGIHIKDVGVIKIESKSHPKILDMERFLSWATEAKQSPPPLTFHDSTLTAWFKEQMDNNLPIPQEDILKVYVKTRAKVNKR